MCPKEKRMKEKGGSGEKKLECKIIEGRLHSLAGREVSRG